MSRLLVAASLAVAFHALLFSLDPGRAREKANPFSVPESISITLDHKETPLPVVEPRPHEDMLSKEEPVLPPKVVKKKDLKPVTSQMPPSRREKKIQKSAENEQAEATAEAPPRDREPPEEQVASIPQNQSQAGQDIVQQPPANRSAWPPTREATPLYRSNPPPEYPAMARRRGYEGIVLVEVLVSKEGRVQELRLSQSSGYSMLDQAAMSSMKQWLFEPATVNEEKVEMWVKVPVRFRLE